MASSASIFLRKSKESSPRSFQSHLRKVCIAGPFCLARPATAIDFWKVSGLARFAFSQVGYWARIVS